MTTYWDSLYLFAPPTSVLQDALGSVPDFSPHPWEQHLCPFLQALHWDVFRRTTSDPSTGLLSCLITLPMRLGEPEKNLSFLYSFFLAPYPVSLTSGLSTTLCVSQPDGNTDFDKRFLPSVAAPKQVAVPKTTPEVCADHLSVHLVLSTTQTQISSCATLSLPTWTDSVSGSTPLLQPACRSSGLTPSPSRFNGLFTKKKPGHIQRPKIGLLNFQILQTIDK